MDNPRHYQLALNILDPASEEDPVPLLQDGQVGAGCGQPSPLLAGSEYPGPRLRGASRPLLLQDGQVGAGCGQPSPLPAGPRS